MEISDILNNITTLRNRYESNNKRIMELKTDNAVIEGAVRNLHEKIKTNPIQLDSSPSEQYEKGERCWVCKHPAYYRCVWCMSNDKPCGYCDNHTHKHKISFPDHIALFQRVLQLKVDKPIKIKMSPEQELAELERQFAENEEKIFEMEQKENNQIV